jgi:hypothetical protein
VILTTFVFQDDISYYEILLGLRLENYWLRVTFSTVPFEQDDGWLPFVVCAMARFVDFDKRVRMLREDILGVNRS